MAIQLESGENAISGMAMSADGCPEGAEIVNKTCFMSTASTRQSFALMHSCAKTFRQVTHKTYSTDGYSSRIA